MDVKSDGAGNIYVADHDNRRIQKFTNNGVYLGELDAAASGPAAFGTTPSCVVDGAGTLYVSDTRGFIDVFDPSLTFARSWAALAEHLALDPSGRYIYATKDDSIIKYNTDTGARISGWPYTANGPSIQYFSFAVGPSGNVYSRAGGALVRKFSADGALIGEWGESGTGNGQFDGCRGVAVGAMENVYVGDAGNCRVQKFTSDGVFLSSWGNLGGGDGQFGPVLISV
jgi:DNA-binding beta-propeller fold protein YncE